MQLPHI
jgi:hypothetical protein